jgi:predicted ArsR family transcriptional regulator
VNDYPDSPGFKEHETSRDAALRLGLNASTLRDRTYQYICDHPQQSADQIAAALNASPWAVRPRVSELRKMGLVINDGRGRNPSGMTVHLWRAVNDPPA